MLNIGNDIEFEIGAGMLSGTNLLTVKGGKEDLFDTISVPFQLTLVKFTSLGVVEYREVVLVTAKAGNVFTVTRAYEPVADNDSATTLTSIAHEFDEGDMAYMTITAKILQDLDAAIAAKLNKSGGNMTGPLNLALGAPLAAAATVNLATITGNSAHITGSGQSISAFGTVVAGAEYELTFDGVNTLVHNATSLILPGVANITTAANDVAYFRSEGSGNWRCTGYQKADGTPLIAPTVQLGFLTKTAYAGEALALTDAVTFEQIHQDPKAVMTTNPVGAAAASTKIATFFLASGISTTAIKLFLSKTGAPTDNFTIRIETDSAGAPSGTLVHANAYQNIAGASLTTTQTDTTVTFAGAFTIPAATKCWIVLGRSNGSMDASNYFNVGFKTEATRAFANKTYNGTAWQASTFTQCLYMYQTSQLVGLHLVKASAAITKFMRVEGFSNAVYAVGAVASYYSGKNIGIFSGLTSFTQYYLSDTYGAISTTAGTNLVKVGSSINTTTIHDSDEDILGTAVLGFKVLAGDTVMIGPSGGKSSTVASALVKAFEIVCPMSGTWRTKFKLHAYGGSNQGGCQGQIWKNGVALGTLRSLYSYEATTEYVEDFTFVKGDLIQLYWSKTDGYGYTEDVHSFSLCANVVPVALSGTITNY